MTPESRVAAIFAVVLVSAALLFGASRTRWSVEVAPGELEAGLSLRRTLEAPEEPGYSRALRPRPLLFPVDHGSHPDHRDEWWYFTGNLAGPDGEEFGYQLTFFRTALEPDPVRRPSAWAGRQLYMAHFTVTDVAGGAFRAAERFARGSLGLAGAGSPPFRVWLGDWRAASRPSSDPGTPVHPADGGLAPLRLRADAEEMRIDLTLGSARPIVLHGEDGLNRKGSSEGAASHYYSLTRMPTRGELVIGGRAVPVRGTSWFDREWSTGALEPDQEGWDWFALRLDDGHDLMFYRLRRENGTTDRFSAGSLVAPDGRVEHLTADGVEIEVLDRWRSPLDGTVYPSRWRLQIPDRELVLEIEPALPDQEVDLTFRYWEGAVRVRGTHRGRSVEGRGYVELTGYAEGGA